MKISFIHSFYSSDVPSGENQVVSSQIEMLKKHGHDVQLVSLNTDNLKSQPLYALKSAINVSVGTGPSPLQQIRNFKPDVVHVHNLFPNWGSNWVEDLEFPLVTTLHNFRPICAAATLYKKGKFCDKCINGNSLHAVKNRCYRGSVSATIPLTISNFGGLTRNKLLMRSNRVVLLSQRSKAIYIQSGLDQEKIEVIPNFVPDMEFAPLISKNIEWVFIGRFTVEKGVQSLIQNWPEDQKIVFYGSGPLEEKIKASTNPGIRFGGNLSKIEVAEKLKLAKGLIFPSEWPEGMPLSYCEALSVGLPVIALAGNSAADDVSEAGNGVVYNAWDEFESKLQISETELIRMSINSRTRFEQKFSEDIWLQETEQMYKHAIYDLGVTDDWSGF